MRKTQMIAFALMTVLSCSKESTSLLLSPGIYHNSRVDAVGKTRVFTKNGEVKAADIVTRFDGIDSGSFTTYISAMFVYTGKTDSIRIFDSKNISILNNYRWHNYTATIKGNNIMLAAKDTTSGVSFDEIFTNTFYYYLGYYKAPVFDEVLISSTGGVNKFSYRTIENAYLEQENNQLKSPWVIAFVRNADGSRGAAQIQNKTDLNFYKTLNPGDTVTIREYVATYDQ